MYSSMVRNEDGEPLGFETVYGDDVDGGVESLVIDEEEFWEPEPVDCCGHATAEETSGDASEQPDGSWRCDYGTCPGPASCT